MRVFRLMRWIIGLCLLLFLIGGLFSRSELGNRLQVYFSLNGSYEDVIEIAKKTCNLSRSSSEYIDLERQYEAARKLYASRYADALKEAGKKVFVEKYPRPESIPTLLVKRTEPGVCQ